MMGRPRKTEAQYLSEYGCVIFEILCGTPYRKIAEQYGVGVCTVQRLHNMGLHHTLLSELHRE